MNVSSSGMESRGIGIVGLGYVGLPLAVAFAETGEKVIGFDLDREKVEAIGRGDSYIEDVPSAKLAEPRGIDPMRPATRPSWPPATRSSSACRPR